MADVYMYLAISQFTNIAHGTFTRHMHAEVKQILQQHMWRRKYHYNCKMWMRLKLEIANYYMSIYLFLYQRKLTKGYGKQCCLFLKIPSLTYKTN